MPDLCPTCGGSLDTGGNCACGWPQYTTARLYDRITDRCLPEGTLGHAACHAKDREEIRALKALLREVVAYAGSLPTETLTRLKAALLEGRDGQA